MPSVKKNKKNDVILSLEEKINEITCLKGKTSRLREIIIRNINCTLNLKKNEIYSISEYNTVTQEYETQFTKILDLNALIEGGESDQDKLNNQCKIIQDNLELLFRQFGCENINDYFYVSCRESFNKINNDYDVNFINLLSDNFHVIKISIHTWDKHIDNDNTKELNKLSQINEGEMIQNGKHLECIDLSRMYQSFYLRVNGMKLIIQNKKEQHTLLIDGIVDDSFTYKYENQYMIDRINKFKDHVLGENNENYEDNVFLQNFCDSLTIKEILVYSIEELVTKYLRTLSRSTKLNQEAVADVVNDFSNEDMYTKRLKLIQLLIKFDKVEYQYLAYLLYDLLANEMNSNIETNEQATIFESFPWAIKKFFRDAMKQTTDYTSKLCNYEINVPLEQQICLMKSTDTIKQKAMVKLKEVRTKNDESGSKARQWLEGLLKIPFGILKEEQVLKIYGTIYQEYCELTQNTEGTETNILKIQNDISDLENKLTLDNTSKITAIENIIYTKKREHLINIIMLFNGLYKTFDLKNSTEENYTQLKKICHSGKNINYMRNEIASFFNIIKNNENYVIYLFHKLKINKEQKCDFKLIKSIQSKFDSIENGIKDVDDTLESCVHGHDNAKRQIKRIIGQWITGENNGYCFGFEGPPGVGKTSLAKVGLAKCLKDANGESRPFGFMAIGGSNSASTLIGHNYTYVGSTWGRIVDILIEKKCMNPIIFIDELDKVSNTEYGKEISSIFTHLVDSTQNDTFHDKYFSGIDIDLSKALFIFSYNDASKIDSILLDRIHRVKFEHLTLDDKLVIIHKHLLPEMYKQVGIKDVIHFDDDVLKYIIEEYTCEPGVRKLKEILFEIISEINLSVLQKKKYEIPIIITKEQLQEVYLKERRSVNAKVIHESPIVGVINGLWANAMGHGGIIPIQAKNYPCGTLLDLKLTGMQGDVMKESMNVAKTLAWSLCEPEVCIKNVEYYEKTKSQGLHIHCPEGATPKDGPSAGTAITVALHSLFNSKKIRNDIAITGEITLDGSITAIGGLDLKIMGGIKAGIKHFIYPKENNKDFSLFHEKYCEKIKFDDYCFTEVDSIHDVLDLVYI